MEWSIPVLKDVATIVAAAIVALTFVLATMEYARQNRQRRADAFVVMRRRLKENPQLSKICALLLQGDTPRLAKLSEEDRVNFLGFFEEVALMMNSRLIRPSVAHHMFGAFAIECSNSIHFWSKDMERESNYWALFHDFVTDMKAQEQAFTYRRRDFRL